MLTLTVFLSGAVLMSLEMVGSRILAPTFGSSIYIWGSLIVVVMAALTLGYYLGGRIADRYPDLLVIGIILAGAGGFIGFLPFWTSHVNAICGRLEPRLGSLMAASAFFFLPSILLATVSPYAVKLAGRNLENLGNVAGRLSAISSTGSVIGTLVTSFFLIPLTGVRNIVHSLGLILLLLALLIIGRPAGRDTRSTPGLFWLRRGVGLVVLVLIVLLVVFWRSTAFRALFSQDGVIYERDTLYNHVKVTQYDSLRYLRFDNSMQSGIDLNDPLRMVFRYTSFLHLGVVVCPQPERVLFIGLGGGSAPMKFLHDYPSLKTVDAVEIDPEVVKVARTYFALPEDPRLRVVTQDGRLFIQQMSDKIARGERAPYDLVIIDAYSASTIPYHLTTLEFLQAVRQVLAPGGAVVSNIIGALAGPYSSLFRAMTRTFDAVFPQRYIFPVYGWDGVSDTAEQNIILIATTDPRYRSKTVWEEQAEELFARGMIEEEVPLFVRNLVDDPLVFQEAWLADVPLLTDDYAPVDTLKHPLL
ncbi:MAG TPA: fused MFS/spermidine synthase [Firmicutes bacterium]|uniref:Polyamine aminopropyltransferase n=1 Tax=Capillibacterium thermochitinicola TaxID=2699427 RepID=A0A8J6LSQ9_9FIRM|nr:fused MFS/spermidine synthase [Capillibacterium thermochitinicola]HHW13074.1 fused MFS/spermidine synthase [Bacillota bacterium]